MCVTDLDKRESHVYSCDMEFGYSSLSAKEASMFRYTFRVDTTYGFSICDVVADSIESAESDLRNRGLGSITSTTLLGSFDLSPQVCLAW